MRDIVTIIGLFTLLSQAPAAPTNVQITAGSSTSSCQAANDCFPKPVNSGVGATGIPPGHTPAAGCSTNPSAGAVLTDCLYTGTLIVNSPNVTIRNSQFNNYVQSNSTNLVIEDSQIGPATCTSSIDAAVRYGNYTVRRVRVRNVGDGPRDSGNNILVEDSFISVCSSPGDHSDGVQGYGGGTNVTIRHNTIDVRPAHPNVTAALFIADNSQPITAQDNLLVGGGYALRIHDDFSPDHGPWLISGNRIASNSWIGGASNTQNTECSASSMTWTNNRLVTMDTNYNILTTLGLVSC